METFPVVDEAVIENAFWIALFLCEGGEEVELHLFTGVAINLDVLSVEGGTEGATRSGRSLPAKPILVLSEPTSMMRGMP